MIKNTSATGLYEMDLNKSKKELQVLLEGNFTADQANEFIGDYMKQVDSITASDYVLRIDCKDLKLITPELQPSLEACYDLYNKSGFQKVIFEISKAPLIKMQLGRIARKVGLKTSEFVEV